MARRARAQDVDTSSARKGSPVKTLPLEEPIHAFGKEIRVLEFYKPHVDDLRVIDEEEGTIAQTISLLARLTRTTQEAIGELGFDDFEEAVGILEGFLGKLAREQLRSASRSGRKSRPVR